MIVNLRLTAMSLRGVRVKVKETKIKVTKSLALSIAAIILKNI